jgi:anti-sigma regulatory factor (Ser/Thr protein kinase)
MTEAEHFSIARPLDLQLAVLRCQRSTLLHGASDLERSVIATIVSELGSNLLKYAKEGTLELRRVRRGIAADVEITASDQGPGIGNLELALTEHFSSGRTLGLGLPGVKRMADQFDIESTPGRGTTVRVRKRLQLNHALRADPEGPIPQLSIDEGVYQVAASVRARRGARVGGDYAVALQQGERLLLGMIDATGHGLAAHELASALANRWRDLFRPDREAYEPTALLRALHDQCVGTAGAAASVALLDTTSGRLAYLAVGNVRACVMGSQRFRGVSRDGLLGRRWPTPFVQHTQLEPGDHWLMWTDGLPEAFARGLKSDILSEPHLPTLADRLVAEHARDHDDAACLIARWQA